MLALLIDVGPLGAALIVTTVSAHTDANLACADADDVPDAFVYGGYVAIDDALNGGSKMMNARLPFCAGAYVMRLAILLPSFRLEMVVGCVHVVMKIKLKL